MSGNVVTTLQDMVRINSVNPAYAEGRPEAAMASYVESFCHEHGIESTTHEVFADRPNVMACIAGEQPQRRIVFEAHTDTVGTLGMENPFEPTICDGFLVGRGSCDNKGGLAAMLHALARVQASGRKPPCEILLAATVDEEFSFGGVQALCKSLEADAAVVAEPTELRVTTACKGCLRWRVVVQGKEAHSAKPHLGTNAIVHMAEVIRAIDQDSQRLESRSHPLLGSATCSIGLIQGGTQVNVVPDLATIEIDRRLLPGEDVDDVLSHYAGILDQLKTSLHGLTCHMEPPTVLTTPVETPAHLPLVERAGEILRDMDLHSELVGVPFSCDASTLAQHGVPSIIFGPGSIDQAHTPHEFVELAQVEQAEDFYYRMMMSDLAGGD